MIQELAAQYAATEEDLNLLNSLEQFILTANQSGIKARALTESSVRHYFMLPAERRQNISKEFLNYSDLIFSAVKAGYNLKDDKRLLSHVSTKLGVVFSDQVYSDLKDGDVIEIYNMNHIQVYRNLSLLQICGYNLLDLLSYEFYELYERSAHVTDGLFKAIQQLSERPYNLEPLPLLHLPEHLMREKFSEEKVTAKIQFKVVYPVYHGPQRFYGMLTIQGAQVTTQVPENISFI